ncbi:MAG: HAMP domain-containing protein [Methanosarcinales archaeon]|nr:HAMP domain-containing protein [Methanosarcinales archaeon]
MRKSKISDLSLRTKIFVFTMMPFVLVSIIISMLSIQNRIKNERELTSNRIESYVALLESGYLSFNSIKQREKIEKLFNEKVLSAELIKRDRSIAFTTGGPEYEINKEQIDKAFQGYIIIFTRQNKILVQISLHPIIVKNTVVGILHLELSFEKSNDRIRQYTLFVLFLNIFGIILSFLLIYFLSKRIILNRLKGLTDMCSEVRRGNLNYRLFVTSHDELGKLALTFNDTAEELAERKQQLKEEKQKVLNNIRELEKYHENLEELVKERTIKLEESRISLTYLIEDVNESRAELDVLNKQLQAANKELEAFAYSVSHDLRAPLRNIDGFSQILLEDYSDILDKQGQHYLQRVRAGTQNMGQLIDDILSLSRSGRHTMDKKTINMESIIREVCKSLKNELKDRKVDFVVHEYPPALADSHLVKIVLTNLLSNALKFTRIRENAKIETGSMTEDDHTVFFIKDNGVGFDMKYASKLFTAFQRLHSAEEYEGSGIGLAIVQRIIHRHGGRVWMKSDKNIGTTFYFTL